MSLLGVKYSGKKRGVLTLMKMLRINHWQIELEEDAEERTILEELCESPWLGMWEEEVPSLVWLIVAVDGSMDMGRTCLWRTSRISVCGLIVCLVQVLCRARANSLIVPGLGGALEEGGVSGRPNCCV